LFLLIFFIRNKKKNSKIIRRKYRKKQIPLSFRKYKIYDNNDTFKYSIVTYFNYNSVIGGNRDDLRSPKYFLYLCFYRYDITIQYTIGLFIANNQILLLF